MPTHYKIAFVSGAIGVFPLLIFAWIIGEYSVVVDRENRDLILALVGSDPLRNVCQMILYMLPAAALGAGLALLLTVRLRGSILHPLGRVRARLDAAAREPGNVGTTMEVVGAADVASLARSFNRYVATLSQSIRPLFPLSDEIREEVAHVVRHNGAIAARIGREVGEIAEIGEEMRAFLKQEELLSDTIDSAADLAHQEEVSTRRGEEVIRVVVEEFDQLLERLRTYVRETRRLGDRVGEIHRNAETLDNIAERSSLLALNVAIEANRSSGGPGGVDVVADEIHLLSEQTIDFTHRMRAGITQVLDESQALVQRLEGEETLLVSGWTDQAREAHRALETMRQSATALSEQVGSISRIHRQQAQFTGKVRRHLKETRRLIQNIVSQVSRNNESIASLRVLFEELERALGRFTLGADRSVDGDGVDSMAGIRLESGTTTLGTAPSGADYATGPPRSSVPSVRKYAPA